MREIDGDENELLGSVELSEWKSASSRKRERVRYTTVRKGRQLSIRL